MKKFFVVGKNCVLLGRELKNNSFKFSVGKTLFDQINFAEIQKVGDDPIVRTVCNNGGPNEAFYILLKVIEKNFSQAQLFIQKEIVDRVIKYSSEIKSTPPKYAKLTDIYADPLSVPWNFMPTEIEDILSFFDKNILRNKKILYAGAGYGKNIWALKNEKYKIDAIEFSNKAAVRANKIFGRKAVMHGDLIKYGVKDKYDVILDIGCLHSIPKSERKKAVENIYKLLKEDGILISRVFKPRGKEWLDRMPFKTDGFGLDKAEIKELFKSFSVKNKYQNKDYIILEAKNDKNRNRFRRKFNRARCIDTFL